MKPNIFDKMIAEIAPGWGAKRAENKAYIDTIQSHAAYDPASPSRFNVQKAWWTSTSSDEAGNMPEYDREALILECLDLYRNSPILPTALKRLTQYAIPGGIRPQARTSSDDWNQEAEDWWNHVYMPTVDFRQRPGVDGCKFQEFVLTSKRLFGGCGFVLLKNGQQQPVETLRIRTPKKFKADPTVRDGVRIGRGGIITGYFVIGRNDAGALDFDKYDFVKAENFVPAWEPWRIDQIHSPPDIHGIIDKLKNYDRTDKSTFRKIHHDSQIWLKRKRQRPHALNDNPRNVAIRNDASGNRQVVEKSQDGSIYNLGLDEDIEDFYSRTPNNQHVPYMEHQLKVLAGYFGIPWEFMVLMFSRGSFSGLLAGKLHANNTFTQEHNYVVKVYLKRTWNWRIAKAMKNGELPMAPLDDNGVSEWWKVDWALPYFESLQPGAQAAADQQQFNMGTTSLKRLNASRGAEREEVLGEKADDIRSAIEKAEALNTEHPGAGVTWQHLINTGVPGAAPTSTPTESKETDEDDEEEE